MKKVKNQLLFTNLINIVVMKMKNRNILCYALLNWLFIIIGFNPTVGLCSTDVIISFGDSLTEGCGNKYLDSCGVKCPIGKDCYDYGDEIETLLIENNKEFEITNFGLGGETTQEGLSRIDAVLNNQCNQNAKYILILEGTNDLTFMKPVHEIKFNLDAIIEKCLSRNLIPLVATIPPDYTKYRGFKQISELNELIKGLVSDKINQGKQVLLVDLHESLEPYWEEYTDPRSCYAQFNENDQLHPNKSGFSAMGATWYESLSNFFPTIALPWLRLLLEKD